MDFEKENSREEYGESHPEGRLGAQRQPLYPLSTCTASELGRRCRAGQKSLLILISWCYFYTGFWVRGGRRKSPSATERRGRRRHKDSSISHFPSPHALHPHRARSPPCPWGHGHVWLLLCAPISAPAPTQQPRKACSFQNKKFTVFRFVFVFVFVLSVHFGELRDRTQTQGNL